MWLSCCFGPGMRDTTDVNLAAFTSAFGFVRHRGLWRAPSDNLSRSRQALSGIGIFSGQNEGTRCISFFSQSRCCRYLFPPPPSLRIHAARRRSRRPVPAMCSALPRRDRSGRPHSFGLPSAKSPQDQPGLRPGAEKPRAIEPRSDRTIAVAGRSSA